MQKIEAILKNKIQEKFFAKPEWKAMKFINHGMGMMRVEEHDDLVKRKAINCHGEYDAVNCDYPKLVVIKSNGEEETVDMGGNLRNITFEKDKRNKDGGKAKIQFFPKQYSNYIEEKRRREGYSEVEQEIVKEFALEVNGVPVNF